MNRGAGAAAAMFLYAAVMVGGGLIAYTLAPEGANAKTALIVPVACAGAMVVSAILSLQIQRVRVLGMIGIHLGLVLPVLFASVIGFRAWKTGDAVTAHRETAALWDTESAAAGADASPEARVAYFKAADAPDHDKSYLRNTLWGLCAASVAAFVLVLSKRPPKEERV